MASFSPVAAQLSSSGAGNFVDGYLVAATGYASSTIGFFNISWTVPPAPLVTGAANNDLLYVYPYLVSSDAKSYVQAVLEYQASSGWRVYCLVEPSSGAATYAYSASVSVQPGQLLTAVVQTIGGNATAGYFYSCQFAGLASTLSMQNLSSTPFLLTSVELFLDAIQPTSGNSLYYPACAAAFTGISFLSPTGLYPSVTWSTPNPYVSDTGEHAVVVSTANPRGQVDLYWTSCQAVCPSTFVTSCPTCASVPPSCAAGLALDPSSSACAACPVGSKCSGGYAAAVPCPAGSVQPLAGQTSCVPCSAGNFSATTSASQCLPCPLGTFTSTAGSGVCQPCGQGTFADHLGAVSCSLCPTNTSSSYSAPLSPSPLSACTACPVGYLTQAPGSAVCDSACGVAPSCQVCPASCAAGSYLDAMSGSCLLCPAGSSCSGHYAAAVPCPLGFNQSSPGQLSCAACPAGQFSPAPGAVSCTPCAAGTFSSSPGSLQCTICAQGSAVNTTGATQCPLCPLNAVSQYPSQGAVPLTACTACPVGLITPSLGSTGCSVNTTYTGCPAGSRQLSSGSCVQCVAGSFSSQAGGLQCLACPTGQFAPFAGAVSCQPCAAGSFTNATGSIACASCPAGEFGAGQGNTGCAFCPAGAFANATGSAQCTACPAGTFSSYDEGSTLLTSCASCPAGTFNPAPGQASCYSCLPQTFSGNSGSTSCQVCTSELSLTITECGAKANTCPAGTALTAVVPTADNNDTTAACVPCPVGYYSPTQGSSQCLLCPAQSYSLLPGSTACLPCEDLAGVTCSNGVVYVDDLHWGYANVERLVSSSSSGSVVLAVNISFATLQCPTGHCQGGNSTQIDWTALADWDPNVQPFASGLASPQDGGSGGLSLPQSQSLAVGLAGQCGSGFDPGSSNLLCGSCQSGSVPGGSGIVSSTCVQCTEAHAGPILSYLLLPWAVVLGYYLLSYGKPGLVSVLLFFVQTCALMMSSTNQWVSWLQFFGYSPTRFATPSSCLGPMSPELQFALPLFTPLVMLFWLAVTVTLHGSLRQRLAPVPEGCLLDARTMRYRFPSSLASAGYSHLCKKAWWAHPLLSLRRAWPWRLLSHTLRTRAIPELTVSAVARTAWLIVLSSLYDVLNTSFQYFYCVHLPEPLSNAQGGLDSNAGVVWAFPSISCSTSTYRGWGVLFAFYITAWLLILITLTAFLASHAPLLRAMQSVYVRQLRLDWQDKRERERRAKDDTVVERRADDASGGAVTPAGLDVVDCSTCGFSQQRTGAAGCPVCGTGQPVAPPPVERSQPRLRSFGCCGVTVQLVTNQPVRPAPARSCPAHGDLAVSDDGLSIRPLPPIEAMALRPLPQPQCTAEWAQSLQALSSLSTVALLLQPWLLSRGLLFAPWQWYWPLQQSEASFMSLSAPTMPTAAELRRSDSSATASAASSTVTTPDGGSPSGASTPTAEPLAVPGLGWERSLWYRFRSLYGCWFDSWHPSAFGWTLVMLLRQLLLLVVNAALVLNPSPRYLAFALVLLSLLLLHLHFRPYAVSQLNRLEAASLTVLLVIALILDTYPPPNAQAPRAVLLVIITTTLLAMLAYAVLGPNELRAETGSSSRAEDGLSTSPPQPPSVSSSSAWTPFKPPVPPRRSLRMQSQPSEVSMSGLRPSAVEFKDDGSY